MNKYQFYTKIKEIGYKNPLYIHTVYVKTWHYEWLLQTFHQQNLKN